MTAYIHLHIFFLSAYNACRFMKEGEQPPIDFFSGFTSSDQYPQILEMAKAYRAIHPDIAIGIFYDHFCARLFESAGFNYLRSTGSHGTRLIDPQKTIEFFQDLYEVPRTPQSLGTSGIPDRYIPDGLLLTPDGSTVQSVIEYTSKSRRANLEEYIRSKTILHNALKRRFHKKFGTSNMFVYLTQNVFDDFVTRHPNYTKAFAGVTIRSLPVTQQELHTFSNNIAKSIST